MPEVWALLDLDASGDRTTTVMVAEKREYFTLEFECLNCGRSVGNVRLSAPRQPIPDFWRTARCSVCGGYPVPSGEIERTVVYPGVPKEWLKRGRKPNWLRELEHTGDGSI